MSVTDRVDWFRIVVDLRQEDLSLRKTCRAVGRALVTVHGWTQGTEPRYYDGERLIAFWCQQTGNVRDSVPRVGQTRPRPVPAKEPA